MSKVNEIYNNESGTRQKPNTQTFKNEKTTHSANKKRLSFGSPPFTNYSNIMSSAMLATKHDAFIKIWVADQQEYLEKWRAVGSGLEFYSWTMFLNYRKSETDVYTDGTQDKKFE